MPTAKLERDIILLQGERVEPWLEGLITNSLSIPITFAALLTPQGKIIADFFITKVDGGLMLDTAKKFTQILVKRLSLYRLREAITISVLDDTHSVFTFWEGQGDIGYVDPRALGLGRRLISQNTIETTGDYDAHRLLLGVVDSQYDFDSQSLYPANANMDRLNGVDFKKGCFIGQEVVSRMYRKTEVRKRLCGFRYDGKAQVGDVVFADGKPVATIVHQHGAYGMALVRLDRLAASETPPHLNDTPIEIMESAHAG